MLEAKLEVHNQTLECHIDALFQAMANHMALTKAIHSGRRVSPDEFYRPPKKSTKHVLPPHDGDAFALMKALFVK